MNEENSERTNNRKLDKREVHGEMKDILFGDEQYY
jgi:hypothetical protein